MYKKVIKCKTYYPSVLKPKHINNNDAGVCIDFDVEHAVKGILPPGPNILGMCWSGE